MANVKATRDPFDALGDPTRRAIFNRVAQEPTAVGTIAEALPVTRPAVSQHLKVLKEAGLVTEEAHGTRRIYRVDPRGIAHMRSELDRFWQGALAAFAATADSEPPIHPEEEPTP